MTKRKAKLRTWRRVTAPAFREFLEQQESKQVVIVYWRNRFLCAEAGRIRVRVVHTEKPTVEQRIGLLAQFLRTVTSTARINNEIIRWNASMKAGHLPGIALYRHGVWTFQNREIFIRDYLGPMRVRIDDELDKQDKRGKQNESLDPLMIAKEVHDATKD